MLVGRRRGQRLVARQLGLGAEPTYGVALEGNLAARPGGRGTLSRPCGRRARRPCRAATAGSSRRATTSISAVGGWEREGPALRDHLPEALRARTASRRSALDRRARPSAAAAQARRAARPRTRAPRRGRGRSRRSAVRRRHVRGVPLGPAGRAPPRSTCSRARGRDLEPYDSAAAPAARRAWPRPPGARSTPSTAFRRLAFALSRPRFVWPVVEGLLRGDLSASRRRRRARARAAEGRPGPVAGSREARARATGSRASSRYCAVQDYVLTSARRRRAGRSRERLDGVRSVAIGFWIGSGLARRGRRACGRQPFPRAPPVQGHPLLLRAGHRGDLRRDRRRAERASPRASTRSSTRASWTSTSRPALDVMTDMVYAPSLADLDSEREVVLEEIAMVEDTPQELVHDLAAAGRSSATIRSAGRARSRRRDRVRDPPARCSRLPPGRYVGAEHRRRCRRQRRSRPAGRTAPRATAQKKAPPPSRRLAAARAARRERRRPRARLPAQGHRAVPRVHRRSRHLARRPPPLRSLGARRHPRRLRLVAALPGDPREARPRLQRLHLRVPVRRDGRDRRSTSGTREDNLASVPRDRRARDRTTSPPAASGTTSCAVPRRASKGASCSRWSRRRPVSTGSGSRVITDTELLVARRDPRSHRGGGRRRRRRRSPASSCRRAALRRGDRAGARSLPRGGRARASARGRWRRGRGGRDAGADPSVLFGALR